MNQRLIGVNEAAEYLGIEKVTLYSWAKKEFIPSVKVGRLVKFDIHDLDEWINSKKMGATPHHD